jgi:transposase
MLNDNKATDGITAGIDARKQRGLEIAALARIDHKDGLYLVPSQTDPRQSKYEVRYDAEHPTCTCPDHETRGCRCKHIYAVEYVIRRERNNDGSTTVTESVTVTRTRKTYSQDWPAYNAAQTNEKEHFQSLLADLCKDIETPAQPNGRPRLPLSDAIFAIVFKVYCTLSARRFASDLCDAQAKGHIAKVPHFNSVLNYLESPDLYPTLLGLIEKSSLPLRSIESQFAVDSTGFTACRFVRWFDVKYNRFSTEQQWVKAHLMCGVKTNVVTAVEIHERNSGDAPHLPSLLKATAKNFTVKELSADKSYASNDNFEVVNELQVTPYFAFRYNATGRIGGLFAKAFHYFQFNRDEFLAHYHQRSNVESTVMMIKSKFGDSVRSKSDVAARNEVLCKILCHNICCLISAIYELGIEPVFEKVLPPRQQTA